MWDKVGLISLSFKNFTDWNGKVGAKPFNTIVVKEKELRWSKDELKTYILLLCARADAVEAKEELDLIRSMSTAETFKRAYAEFCGDDEGQSIEKIRNSIQGHDYSYWELAKLWRGIEDLFASDGSMVMKERNLGKILDGILY